MLNSVVIKEKLKMKKSNWIAIALSGVLLIWMGSGFFMKENSTPKEKVKADEKKMSVQTEIQKASTISLFLTAQSFVEPLRQITLRSEINGKIIEIPTKEGSFVQAETPLLQIAMDDRNAKLAKEQALLNSKKQTFNSMKALAKEKFQSKNMLEQARAEVKAAEADVAKIQLEIANTQIRAPFDGIFAQKGVEVGSYVTANTEVGRFVDNSQVKVIASIAQHNIQSIQLKSLVNVLFASKEKRQGIIEYIAPVANETTRTFRVEIRVDNSDNSLFTGTTAEVQIPTGKTKAHLISPGILSIDDIGNIGLKLVQNNVVQFYPIEIIQSQANQVWVSGLPETANIITVGQGFVENGLEVSAITSKKTIKKAPNQASFQESGAAE